MKHFTTEQWADFARGAVAKKDKSIMQSHLETECKRCAKEMALWKRVVQTAKRGIAAEPSQGAVRYAKAMFAAQGHRSSAKTAPAAAGLLFDSMGGALPIGVRSLASSGPRQLLYGLGDHRIDLRLEPLIDSEKVSIIGQVLDSANPQEVFNNIPVYLYLDEKVVATAETNDFGEFQIECSLAGRLQLRAVLPQGQEISVVLLDPAAPFRQKREGKKSTRKKV